MSLPKKELDTLAMSKWRVKRSGAGMAIIGEFYRMGAIPTATPNCKITGISEIYISANDGKLYAKFAETSLYFAHGKMELFTDGW